MTTSHYTRQRARERLEQYQQAQRDLRYLLSRIETLEARVMGATTPTDAHAGWTGSYLVRRHKQGWIETDQPRKEELEDAQRIRAVPRTSSGTPDPKSGEKLLAALIDQQLGYEKKAQEALTLCKIIECEIEEFCDHEQAVALKYRYIEGLSHVEARERLHYSETSWFRLMNSALDAFGSKIGSVWECLGVNGSIWEY